MSKQAPSDGFKFRAMYAASGKAMCKGCKQRIGDGTLRIAVRNVIKTFSGQLVTCDKWFHVDCLLAPKMKMVPKNPSEIKDFAILEEPDKRVLADALLFRCAAKPGKKNNKRASLSSKSGPTFLDNWLSGNMDKSEKTDAAEPVEERVEQARSSNAGVVETNHQPSRTNATTKWRKSDTTTTRKRSRQRCNTSSHRMSEYVIDEAEESSDADVSEEEVSIYCNDDYSALGKMKNLKTGNGSNDESSGDESLSYEASSTPVSSSSSECGGSSAEDNGTELEMRDFIVDDESDEDDVEEDSAEEDVEDALSVSAKVTDVANVRKLDDLDEDDYLLMEENLAVRSKKYSRVRYYDSDEEKEDNEQADDDGDDEEYEEGKLVIDQQR